MVGQGVSVVKRGKAVARKDEVLELLGIEPHLELNCTDPSECCNEAIEAELHKKSVSPHSCL